MRLKIHPLYILFAGVYILLGQGYIFICYFVAVVLHELAHLYFASKLGLQGEKITLYPFGGEVKLSYINLCALDEIKLALSGPLCNLLLSSFILSLNWLYPSIYPYTQFFYMANLFNGILNLIPVYPLDGGRVLCALLKTRLKKQKAIFISMLLGYVFCGIVIAFGVYMLWEQNFSFLVLGVFLLLSQIEMQANGFENLTLNGSKRKIMKSGSLTVMEVLVHEDTLLYKLLSLANKDGYHVFYIVNDRFEKRGKVTENQLYEMCLKNDIYAPIKKLI